MKNAFGPRRKRLNTAGSSGKASLPRSLRERSATHSARLKLTSRLVMPISATPATDHSTVESGSA
ncbi:hypothetical protein D3C86_2243610 [compost metagenome]